MKSSKIALILVIAYILFLLFVVVGYGETDYTRVITYTKELSSGATIEVEHKVVCIYGVRMVQTATPYGVTLTQILAPVLTKSGKYKETKAIGCFPTEYYPEY